MKLKDFGWNNLSFKIPEDARLASEGGNAKTGYMRLEAEKCFLEVKWEEIQPKKLKPISEVVVGFVKKLEKDTKQKIPVTGKRSTTVFGHDALFLTVRSNLQERVFFWYCGESLRVVIFRFAFQLMDTTSRTIIKEVLASLRCHGEESNAWSLFEFSFKAPSSFQLSERKMMIGRTYLLLDEQKLSPFAERRRQVFLEYFSMANVQFKDEYQNLDTWIDKRYRKELKKRYHRLKIRHSAEEKMNEHVAIVKKGTGKTGIMTRKSSLYTIAAWYCEDLNRIYSVWISEHIARPFLLKRSMDDRASEDFARGFLSSLKCH